MPVLVIEESPCSSRFKGRADGDLAHISPASDRAFVAELRS